MKVYPLNGLVVYDPAKGDALPEKGREVPDNVYWRRRLRFKEVSLTAPVSTTSDTTSDTASVAETVAPAAEVVADTVASVADSTEASSDASAAAATEDGAQ